MCRFELLARICNRFRIDILYVFGSRAGEVKAWLERERGDLPWTSSDVDIGVKPLPGERLSVRDKVRLAMALEDLFGVGRVDLVVIPEVDPFLAVDIIRSMLREANPFVLDIVCYGRVLHDDGFLEEVRKAYDRTVREYGLRRTKRGWEWKVKT